ncbi:uncharacterized protein LOC121247260 [Juglans microcarpa x Juglans regia]|uniref:uncharacterized protein LOC121247260 n=1 Tax=Juglans microcarpa x Juglans regia TaxID=2249226 RepID=UPI001B7E94E0|nr:uncharacterized protein LOC121247260 [Juglans microcarpa x Juglans regia]
MDDFRGVLQDCKLKDLGFIQGKYTWSNFRQDHNFTKEKLDRATANSEWCAAFGGGEVQVLASSTSDHYPLLITVGQQNDWTRKPVQICRYEDSWSLFTECEDVIHNAWQRYGRNKEGLTKINKKLEGCLQVLKHWSYQKECASRDSLKQKRKSLQHLQQSVTAKSVQQLRELQTEIDNQLKREDVKWKQMAKEN